MRYRAASIFVPVLALALALSACATPAAGAGESGRADIPSPAQTDTATDSSSTDLVAETSDPDAQARAQAWLDAAVLPPGAVPANASVASFLSSAGWPCGPVVQLEAFWSIPGATVSETANWLRDNPTADLVTTAVGRVSDDPAIDETIVGYIPAVGAQEGIVYTVHRTSDGVAVRAEVAAQTPTATCPPLPDGGQWGAPGQG